jgi:polysaccharide biosynthesis/export protein
MSVASQWNVQRMLLSLRRAGAAAVLIGATACVHPAGGTYIWVDELPDAQLAPPAGEYRFVSGDMVAVQVFNHPEISGRTRVREDGRLSVSLLGDLMAAGRSPTDLAHAVEAQLAERNLAVSPRATVILDERAPFRIAVIGEVSKPGLFPLDAGAGVAEALASAGGFAEFAHRDQLYVVRRQPEAVRIRFRYRDLAQAKGKAADFRLRSGDVVVVE